ncbi:putative O-glycosylation ligase, exosortase A system-associated [Rhodovibrio salinarum]|nr:putative O-glycosylation ligase, exosortase A system-associated [Rhodovibrio salinarum]
MLNIFILLAVLCMAPLALLSPFVGLLGWHWIAFMNPHRLGWGAVETVPAAMIVGAFALGAWMISREPKRPPRDWIVFVLFMLAVWISITTVFALVPEGAFRIWDRSIKILLFTYVTLCLTTNVHRLHALIWITVLSIGFFSMKGGLFTITTGGQYLVWGPKGSFIQDNNQLAMAVLMTLPLFFYLSQNAANRYVRWGLLAGLVLSVFSVVGSQSRGAFVSLVIVSGYLALKSRHRLVFAGLGASLLVALIFFLPESWIERMQSIQEYEQDKSVQGRFDAWTYAWRIFEERPLVGGGFRAYYDGDYFMALVPDALMPRAWHSVYFEVLGEHGGVGIAIFLTLLLMTWLRASQLEWLGRRHALAWASDLGRMCKASLVAFATAGMFLNMAFFDLYYVIIAVVVCGYSIAAQESGETRVSLRESRRARSQARTALAPRTAAAVPVPRSARPTTGGPR